ncbi:sn-glycerol-3-phosphate ABC transporter ATP-binding protein UgpC [Calidifontibacter sp. DB0510]|uniref:Sn-glycerol-3-phosphate ABC transporter ATP-binding protein UgpC n=1 Tax=Metallococcus carri TaxID=1656884 RepID=A0A967AZ87_9MICO|nr:sn-glycerol-3-phosphate ABC transporter ATP-binding protein UgpC [Metallococcus carri]NHN55132.1 sn-glycerol-3-phosphate ABC transporter ATP-binding protein UgpC [Metallococcus carri]NOP36209.1 sn-glycerol-3-phosphate ABC transporter ATP-binding protein UgpC [Calidifontibacter sp. DB2511S]
MSSIELKNIVKKYGDGFPAVNDVSLDIADGEFMILVGPSGCGKSTLLRMVVGLEDITSGDLLINGKRVNDLAPRDRNLSMVFQNYALYPHLTVFENIAFPLRLAKGKHSDDEIRSKVNDAANMLELKDHLERKPANLSGGQRQRVAMGRAIVRDAEAFLFDEPLSNLDAKLRGQMRTEIARMQRRLGVTTIYVTHDQTEAMTLGDRVAVLKKGVLQQVASPRELYEQPVNLFVAGFIGSPPMNFLPARVDGSTLKLPFCEVPVGGPLAEKLRGLDIVIVGLRPEYIKDASVADVPNGVHFSAVVDQTEWLGNEQYAYIPYEADHAVQSKLDELDRDLDGEGMRTQMIVNLDSRSRILEGDEAQFAFDPAMMHVFNPETGENLTRDDEKAAQIARDSEQQRKAALERARAREAQGADRSAGDRSAADGSAADGEARAS